MYWRSPACCFVRCRPTCAATAAELDLAIDKLIELEVPYTGLGGGLWRAAYSRGETPRWERNAKLLPFLPNIAGQEYDLESATVVNYGEVTQRRIACSVHLPEERQ